MSEINCVFFYSGVFSQWYPSKFKFRNIEYNTAEQYMMFHKAVLFKDMEIAEKILHTTSPREQKSLGRRVRHFNQQHWEQVARKIVYDGNRAKFLQNPDLLKKLIITSPKILVEASSTDAIWGIGLDEDSAIKLDPSQWPGKNWLGLTLTEVRDDIIKDIERKKDDSIHS